MADSFELNEQDNQSAHRYWHSRGVIPHFDQPGLLQSLTFCLADALPATVIARMERNASAMNSWATRESIDRFLDAGYGACYLREPRIAAMVQSAFFFFDGQRYRLLAWVIMPNHVHVVIEVNEGHPLHETVFSWKSYTAKQANMMLGRTGRFWSVEYFDRVVRNERHYANLVRYVHNNPVKAGLARNPEDWMYSSARNGGIENNAP